MDDTAAAPQAAGPGWFRRWGWMVTALALASCCAWSGLGAWLFGPLTPWLANRLSYVQGKAELIAPAQWQPGGILSPDGRYMVAGWTRNGQRERLVWNLVTGEQHPFPLNLGGGALCWLNPEQFVMRDSGSERYYLIQAHSATVVQATLIIVKDQFSSEEG